MTTDYFAALAARVVHPERGIQPRRRTIFDAPAAPARAGALPETATGMSKGGAEVPPDHPLRAVPGPPGIERDSGSEPFVARGDGRVDATGTETPRRDPSGEAGGPSVRAHPLPVAAGQLSPSPDPIAARIAASALVPDTVADRARQMVDVVPGVRRPDAHAPAAAMPSRVGGDSEPVVRIHIGRVDVRAVLQTPAGPQAPRAAKPGLMSLEEYVRQQREGRR